MLNPLLTKLIADPKEAMKKVPYNLGIVNLPQILLVVLGDSAKTSGEDFLLVVKECITEIIATTTRNVILDGLLLNLKKEVNKNPKNESIH